jgi:hypothetical protein
LAVSFGEIYFTAKREDMRRVRRECKGRRDMDGGDDKKKARRENLEKKNVGEKVGEQPRSSLRRGWSFI